MLQGQPKVNFAVLLSQWLPALPQLAQWQAIEIANLYIDSRQVTAGDAFVAIAGHQVDGRQFIDKAIAQGAVAVFAETDSEHAHGQCDWQGDVPVLWLDALATELSALGHFFYQAPSQQMTMAAVTGTNGKTTISQILAQWAQLLGCRAGVMGTNGNGLLGQLQESANTTADGITVQRQLAALKQAGANFVAMEVSSHGLHQGRIAKVHYDVGIFTNLTRDHLDYHGDMASYAAAKKLLFTEHDCRHAVIFAGDETGHAWLSDLPDAVAVGLNAMQVQGHCGRKIWATEVQYSQQGVTIAFDSSWGRGQFNAALVGAFNVANLLCALAALLVLGHDKSALLACAPALQAVVGRMEIFHQPGQAMAVVDYAHAPDALEQALKALRHHCDGDLWCLVGCGGDRDRGKRPMMAEIAERLADRVILTDDNPRSESPDAIIADMQAGMQHPERVAVIHSRFDACAFALANANEQDIILVAGKGHEDYQIYGQDKRHYSDRETLAELLGRKA
ncbi:UDP-N-acetylmuramoyl-L-alanyl-D-glutamate--2, 6-diaminopimelate ligase [Vibrio stylophorae]|uniref:UDP-N-acetylmuramoyl-L-alanyl-D-glutamate--2,6-diaminopimelate ligase n=1 Tax=Vibrio stylophorae TaxID=659351 RepID=A0ABN8DVY8_9VIBR|nr:UDP-N-acetylmuramoyl-L-alanyl-D-glutamate--2,6-diaminopimelate ligase [Vibrio stylophorae]CAH0534454.1 UDP-N-acetylmuramoyl-L-alanyl-D-glutamate--2, 6-diaminopimelate ligase [Vibrio stylophorae]